MQLFILRILQQFFKTMKPTLNSRLREVHHIAAEAKSLLLYTLLFTLLNAAYSDESGH
jgi:cytochrome b561